MSENLKYLKPEPVELKEEIMTNDANKGLFGDLRTRPSTAVHKAIERLSIFGLGNPWNLAASHLSGNSLANGGSNSNNSSVSALNLKDKITKITKIENKLLSLQKELADDLGNWSGSVQNHECQKMVTSLKSLYAQQTTSRQSVLEKLDKIKLSFHFINERERKQKELVITKNKLLKQIKESEIKHGKKSSNTMLLSEKIEENTVSLEVITSQCIRAISNDLRDSVFEYSLALHYNLKLLNDATAEFNGIITSLNLGTNNALVPKWQQFMKENGQPQKSASPGISRILSQESPNSPARTQENNPNSSSENSPLVESGDKQSEECRECALSKKYGNFAPVCTHKNQGSANLNNYRGMLPNNYNNPSEHWG